MNVSEASIRRPVMTTLIMMAILVFGLMAYRQLPVSDLPNVDFPTISVSASLPGANPDTMASAVATPLEREFTTIAGLDSMNSTNALGSTQITLSFNLNRDIDAAAQDVQSAIARTLRLLPGGMDPPSFRKVNPADSPILYLALVSPILPLSDLDEFAQTMIAQRVSMIPGVAQVVVYGSQKYAVRIAVDPNALASRGIGLDEVASAVQSANVNLPTGTLSGTDRELTLNAKGQLLNANAYKPLIIAYRNGAPVRLQDIGTVSDSVQNDKVANWLNKTRSIVLAIQRQPGTNTVQVASDVRELIPTFKKQLPGAVTLSVLFDRSDSIRASIHDVNLTFILTLALVVLVILLFLGNLTATIIPSLALPLSIVGTFGIMLLLDYSLDNLSLMALTLSIGFVVDDAIVVLENIVRHVESGEKPFHAAIRGAKEISFTILSMTLSLTAVFIPIFFMGGIVGRLFREFSVTIAVAILISGFISLTFTPMLASRFLRPAKHKAEAKDSWFARITHGYAGALRWVLRHSWQTMVVAAIVFAATLYLFTVVPTGFLPSEDTGQIFTFTEAAEGISFREMAEHQQKLAAIVDADPNVEAFMSAVGSGGASSSNSGRMFIRLKPRGERLPVDKVIQELRGKLSSVPGIRAFMQNPPPIRIGGQLTKSLYQVTIQSADTSELYSATPKMIDKMRTLPGLLDVTSDLQLKNPQVDIEINRDRAASLGVSVQQIESTLASAYGSGRVSTIYAPNNQYWVILELAKAYQGNPDALGLLNVRSSKGDLVPLASLVTAKPSYGPLTVNHTGQLPAVTLSFNLAPGISLGDAVKTVEAATRDILPAGATMNFQGTAQAFQESFKGLWLLLIAAIVVIYVVLGILYESFFHPITILSGLPFAGFGALLTLLVFKSELNVYSFVGIILLIGIVKKNAIMMIDFALEAERNEGLPPAESIFQACVVRFRPIMMTTMAALMAALPIAFGLGAGAESRRPLGLAVVGGLAFSQILTLFFTPVMYLYMERFRIRFFPGHPPEGPTQTASENP